MTFGSLRLPFSRAGGGGPGQRACRTAPTRGTGLTRGKDSPLAWLKILISDRVRLNRARRDDGLARGGWIVTDRGTAFSNKVADAPPVLLVRGKRRGHRSCLQPTTSPSCQDVRLGGRERARYVGGRSRRSQAWYRIVTDLWPAGATRSLAD